jgi:heptaprenyl diphosphate synthase
MQAPNVRDIVDLPSVWSRMEQVEERIFEVTQSSDEFLTEVSQHLLKAGGKRYRPLLAQLCAELGTPKDRRPVDAGVAVELIHVGSLYHDDVIDESDFRRGNASANANWTNTVAILAGDFLMARASEVAATELGQDAVRLLARTYAELVEGQTIELQLDHDLNHSPSEYYKVIGGKTASLIRTSARLGAIAADCSPADVEAISDWAWELGMLFQVSDDALDLVASDDYLGKPAGSDITEGKITLPVLYALGDVNGQDIRDLLGQPPYDPKAVSEVIQIVRASGHIERSLDEATARMSVAETALDSVGTPAAREVLTRMGGFLTKQVDFARSSV